MNSIKMINGMSIFAAVMVAAIAAAVAGFGSPGPGQAALPVRSRGALQAPVLIYDDEFLPEDWTVTAEATGGATYTVTQRLTGGGVSPPFRFMSHRLPPVSSDDLATILVTHIYLGFSYDPSVRGEIGEIDYSEFGIILSFPFPEAFSTTQPVVSQGGRIYRSPQFIRFIAQNSTHDWESKSLSGLTAADFVAADGSGDHPDFTESGSPIQFGFTRSNSRSSTLPPVPADQDMVIDQGVDHWQLIISSLPVPDENFPPRAEDDVFILDGYKRSLPFFEIFDVVRNDSDPDQDYLEVVQVTEPVYGTAGSLSEHTIVYQLTQAVTMDSFRYTISDGALSDDARVDVIIDCACTVLCLNNLEPPPLPSNALQPMDDIDLPLIYRVRDQILKSSADGQRYIGMYYESNPEILVNILMNESLRTESIAAVVLWQDNLRSLTGGDGNAVITQAQVDAVESFLNNLSAVSSPVLQQLIADELLRIGPLDDYVGMTMNEARIRAIGSAMVYLPLAIR